MTATQLFLLAGGCAFLCAMILLTGAGGWGTRTPHSRLLPMTTPANTAPR